MRWGFINEGGGNTISYDPNGNLLNMPDKGINSIQYNYLNLPNALHLNKYGNEDVTINTKYRADGTRLRKENTTVITGFNGSTTTIGVTDYLDGFQYFSSGTLTPPGGGFEMMSKRAMQPQTFSIDNLGQSLVTKTPDLQYFATAEGFYDYKKDQYIYQYKDQLGNVRVSYGRNSAGALEIVDANDYYPFGMNHLKTGNAFFGQGSYKNNKYNGKELQETGMYSYGWRDYMPDIARWNGIDQLAESYHSTSPYAYVANNPALNFDVDGRWFNEDGSIDTSGYTPGIKTTKSYASQFLGKDPNEGGGGGSSTGGMTFTGTSTIQFLQGFFGNGGSVGALFSFIEQLKNAGFKDPANTKPKFEDASKISKISAISDLVSILNYVAKQPAESNIFFEKTNNWMVDGQSQGYKILLNVGNIDSVLELAYVIGHETNHSITDYFRNIFYETVGSKGPMGRNALGYFTELISYSWEEKWGNTRRNMNASDYTYYMHGPNSPSELLRHSQNEVDLVKKNMKTLLNLYNKFITIPK